MITIKTDKGLADVTSWDEITSRIGFMANLDPTKHGLASIIGRYAFSTEIRCGLSNCHQGHKKGYVVATKDGRETNIGKDCGKTYFGVEFVDLARTFDRDIEERDYRDALWKFRFKEDQYLARLGDLRRDGADWVYKGTQALLNINRGCPTPVVREIDKMVKRRDGNVMHEREATREELDMEEARTGRRLTSMVITEIVATIQGIETLYPENDLRKLMIIELDSPLREFARLDIDVLQLSSLRKWSIWAGTVEGTLSRIAEIRDLGRTLLTKDNLKILGRDLKGDDDRAAYEAFLQALKEPQS